MSDAQVWTALGLLAAAMTALVTLVLVTINAKFDAVQARFDRVDVKLEYLDRDVRVLMDRNFPSS